MNDVLFLKQKSIFEIRFPGSPFFKDMVKINKLITHLGDKFDQTNLSNSELVLLLNPKTRTTMQIQSERVGLDQDHPASILDFIKLSKDSIEYSAKELCAAKLNRIGLRNIAIARMDNIESAKRYVNSFINISEKLKQSYGEVNGSVLLSIPRPHNISLRIRLEPVSLEIDDLFNGESMIEGYTVDVDISKVNDGIDRVPERIDEFTEELKNLDTNFGFKFVL